MTKVTIEQDGIKISAELDNNTPAPDQVFELFRAVFLGSTYTWEQWIEEMKNQIEYE